MGWVSRFGCLEVQSLTFSFWVRFLSLGYLNPIVIYVEGGCCGFVMMVIFIFGNFDKDEE